MRSSARLNQRRVSYLDSRSATVAAMGRFRVRGSSCFTWPAIIPERRGASSASSILWNGQLCFLSAFIQTSDERTCLRAVALTQLITRWPVEYIAAAHPLWRNSFLKIPYIGRGPGMIAVPALSVVPVDNCVKICLTNQIKSSVPVSCLMTI